MTTYGTIPTSSNPNPSPTSHLQFMSHAKSRIQSTLTHTRPWKEFLNFHSLSFPTSFSDAQTRVRINLSHFRMNYALITLLILFLSLLYHPISLIVFIITMAAWLFFYFLRDTPLQIFGRVVDDRIVLLILAVLTVVALFFTNATVNIVVALVIGLVVVVVHGVVRRTEDLPLGGGDFDEEVVGPNVGFRATGGLGEKLQLNLKDAASASYSKI